MWNIKYGADALSTEQIQTHRLEKRLVVAGGGGERGWTGSLGLVNANYYIRMGKQ